MNNNNFEDIAEILEEAARQLRIAGKALASIPSLGLSTLTSSDFNVRTRKCLKRHGITTVQSLERCTADDLLEIKNFGFTSLTEVREFLAKRGKSLIGEKIEPIGDSSNECAQSRTAGDPPTC